MSNDLATKNKAQLNLLSSIVQNRNQIDPQGLQTSIPAPIANIRTNLDRLPVTRSTIYDRLNLVQSLICLQPNTREYSAAIAQQCPASSFKNSQISWAEIESEINIALEQAEQLQDRSARAYALGYLGAVDQQRGKLTSAQQLTERALLTIDSNAAPEIAYLWQWQLGRIYQLQNRSEKALQAYNAAFESLQPLRANLVAIDSEMQFAFRDRLKAQVTDRHPIVHLATHGQFSSRAEDTFLLTWDDRINVNDLDGLLQDRDFTNDTPIELLILSACQTATGDNQAALGLAGVAVRSGARSTLATLWSIQDDSTAELMTHFYQALKTPKISKSEALRQAQLSLLRNPKYRHPFYWSAFVLVGNWL